MKEIHNLPLEVQEFIQPKLREAEALHQQLRGAICLYCDTHGMKGETWALSLDGARLIKQENNEDSPGNQR